MFFRISLTSLFKPLEFMRTQFLLSFKPASVFLNVLVFIKFVCLGCSNGSPTGGLVWVSITMVWVVTKLVSEPRFVDLDVPKRV